MVCFSPVSVRAEGRTKDEGLSLERLAIHQTSSTGENRTTSTTVDQNP